MAKDGDVPTEEGEVPTMDVVEGLGSTTASVTTTDFAIGPLVAATASLVGGLSFLHIS